MQISVEFNKLAKKRIKENYSTYNGMKNSKILRNKFNQEGERSLH